MSYSSGEDIPPDGPGLADVPALVRGMREASRRARYMEHPLLTYLFWESTLRCNLRCTHCGSSCGENPPAGELGTVQVLDALQSICEDFDASRISLSVTGGEPLLRPDLEEVTQLCRSAGMRVGMVTNGTLATVSRARDLAQAGMTDVSVSIDGPRDLHDAVRGAGSFDRAVAGVVALKEGGIPHLEVVTCVRPANVGMLQEVEAVVRDLSVRSWRLLTIDRMGRAATPMARDTWLDPPDVVRLLDFVRNRRSACDGPSAAPQVRFSCGGYLGPRNELAVRPGDGQCFAGICVASILHDGAVSACPSLPRDWVQGSVLEDRFSRIWRERFEAHRQTAWRRSGPCADCSWFKVCLGGGLHERLAQPDSFCWLKRQSTE